jgi:hypothetical protein
MQILEMSKNNLRSNVHMYQQKPNVELLCVTIISRGHSVPSPNSRNLFSF